MKTMRYVSTRGKSPALNFAEAVQQGLAPDGGLYVPESWPHWSANEWVELASYDYQQLALTIIREFVGGTVDDGVLQGLIEDAYASFRHTAITPLTQIDHQEWILELFHGPTLAFKDVALQFLGGLLEYLNQDGKPLTVVGATSGDTGSAAIAGLQRRANMQVFILHPAGRVSEVQRRQMTTVLADNIHNIAIEGSFDDCQAIVKELFVDAELSRSHRLTAVNSINWARLLAQVVYYAYAALQLGGPERSVAFSVPTGNFGDVFAGYVAQKMGLPIHRLVVATNRNDILTRFFQAGDYSKAEVFPTMAPSMDIQISSNFERFLFDLVERDSAKLCAMMEAFHTGGKLPITPAMHAEAQRHFSAYKVDEKSITAAIRELYDSNGYVMDPHTAIGVVAGQCVRAEEEWPHDIPLVHLATAHPAKFPHAVKDATGQQPELPAHMSGLFQKEERYETLPNDIRAVKRFITSRS